MKFKFALLTFVLLSACFFNSFAQDFSSLKDISFKHKTDYKSFDAKMLECSNYILSTSQDDKNENRQIAIEALVKWMNGTPDYKFHVDESLANLLESDPDILTLYLTAMAKYVLENPSQVGNRDAVKFNAYNILLNYCENKNNHIKQTKELKKLIEAKNNGKLVAYLKV